MITTIGPTPQYVTVLNKVGETNTSTTVSQPTGVSTVKNITTIGSPGPQGPQGPKGDPGDVGNADLFFQVLNKFSELDTPQKKVDARVNLELQYIDCGTFE